ncbi:MAG: hydrogenase 3 maturation endopeptidase HyCI [Nitrospirae bacterium]|nr:hydrogenase 3 maturation endopeptidase HyCI [Nitrospirota bacterium]
MTDEVRDALRPAQIGKTVVLGVGNTMRSDDGVGPYVVNRLASIAQVSLSGTVFIDAGSAPEDFVEDIIAIRPSKIVIIDGADFGGYAGELRLIAEENIPSSTLTTHSFPLSITTRLIATETGCKVFFIGIQVKSTAFGESISKEICSGADSIVDFITKEALRGADYD